MKILVLGGTRFIGRSFIEQSVLDGHSVTMFNRGITNNVSINNVQFIQGDRNKGFSLNSEKTFDVVLDFSGYIPRHVIDASNMLKGKIPYYVFISSAYVYQKNEAPYYDESSPIVDECKEQIPVITKSNYANLKVSCENVLRNQWTDSLLILRPGPVSGLRDHSGRIKYWIDRVSSGEEFIVPGNPDRIIQILDVKDLVKFIMILLQKQSSGIYNCAGDGISQRELLEACRNVTGCNNMPIWVDESFFRLNNNIMDIEELPFWNNGIDDKVSSKKAKIVGLTHGTIEDLLADVKQTSVDKNFDVLIEKNITLLKLWKQSKISI